MNALQSLQIRGYRNGYKERSLRSAEGRIPIHLPQLRDTDEPYQSKLWSFLKRNSDVLEYLVAEMYALGSVYQGY